VSKRYGRTLSVLLAFAFLAVPLRPQSTELQSLRGELRSDSAAPLQDLFVDLLEVATHNQIHRIEVFSDGRFEFRGVPYGHYDLHVTDLRGNLIHQEYVTVFEHMPGLEIRLPASLWRPTAPGTVSVTQLLHPPSKKAVQAFMAAQRFAAHGKQEEAAEELEKAVRISPEFAAAHTNLAVQRLRMGRYQEATGEISRAMQIAGPDPMNLCNLAYAQFQLGKVAEAQASAQSALNLDSSYPQAHLILGTILANDPARRGEAVRHLERAAESIPSAKQLLAKLR
jgi:tetratricopeptide (TPR) repeat protein